MTLVKLVLMAEVQEQGFVATRTLETASVPRADDRVDIPGLFCTFRVHYVEWSADLQTAKVLLEPTHPMHATFEQALDALVDAGWFVEY
jgi:hypothetical protein